MKRRVNGFIRLSRYREYLFFVIITTLLGAIAGHGEFGWRLLGILAANWLAVAFAFMINDVEDAPDDALNPDKVMRNPVSANDISRRQAQVASWIVAAIAALLYALVGLVPFLIGLATIILGFMYSWRGFNIRLKNKPFLDLASHCMLLAGFQFLSAYFSFTPTYFLQWFFPFLMVVCISLYGELYNELRDLDGDREAGLAHTGIFLGYKLTYWLMMICLVVGTIAGIITFFVIWLAPLWVVLMIFALLGVLFIPAFIKLRKSRSSLEAQKYLQRPIEIAAALGLLAQLVYPWAARLIQMRVFGF